MLFRFFYGLLVDLQDVFLPPPITFSSGQFFLFFLAFVRSVVVRGVCVTLGLSCVSDSRGLGLSVRVLSGLGPDVCALCLSLRARLCVPGPSASLAVRPPSWVFEQCLYSSPYCSKTQEGGGRERATRGQFSPEIEMKP